MARVAKQRADAYAALGKILDLPEDELTNTFEHVPRRTLLVVNASSAGLAAITAEALEAVFSSYDGFERVYLTHGQPYSFALFRSGDEARAAKDALHARLCPQLRVGKVLFLEYVTHRTFARMAGVAEEESARTDTLPSGLDFYPNFISEEEEQAILLAIEQEGSKPLYVQGRKVRHYGYAFDYHIKHVSRERALLTRMELPSWTARVEERLKTLARWGQDRPDQLTVQHYPPGAGIGFHADSHTAFEGAIAILSLGAPVVMDFRHPHSEAGGSWPKGQGNPRPLKGGSSIDLLTRSLLLITGEARYNWEHAIRPRRSDPAPDPAGIRTRHDRWSLTFRRINKDVKCVCGNPLCDTDNHVVRALRAERVQGDGEAKASFAPPENAV